MVDGFDYDSSKDIDFCESCVEGKIHRFPFPTDGGKQADEPLELIHSDVCGKMSTKSIGGAEYFLTFIDDKTRYVWVYMLTRKDEVFQRFQEWKALVENSSGHKVKVLRTDNGGEYTSNEFESYLKDEGIRHERTVPKTPEQNGVSERMNRTLVEMMRSMLIDSKLPQRFWAEALSTAVYLRNRSPTKAVNGSTPFEAWTGDKPHLKLLRRFGCVAYTHIAKDERHKLDSKARKCILLGSGDSTKGYRLYDFSRKRVIHSRDVIFNEDENGIHQENEFENCESRDVVRIDWSTDDDQVIEEEQESGTGDTEQSESDVQQEVSTLRRSNRERKQPNYYGNWVNIVNRSLQEPTTVKEAIASKDKEKWKVAMEKEMESIQKNEVWDLVKLPEGRKAVGSKWVFKQKLDGDGVVERYKARIVAQGYCQKYGVDYDETFCPVVRFESVRTVIALAVQYGLKLHQMDVSAAFLNGDLKEDVYMTQPESFVIKGKEHLVCKLKRSLYGLKQSPRCWNSVLDSRLKLMGFKQANSDTCIYTAFAEGEMFIIAVYVDDIILAGKSDKKLKEVKDKLAKYFEVKDMGQLHYFLGLKVVQDQDKGTVFIGQPGYIESVLEKFGMQDAKAVKTPVSSGSKLVKATEDEEPADQCVYQSAVGSLLYLSTRTRPDIAFAVSNVATFCSNPAKSHWIAVKRIIRYLKGTTHLGLLYTKNDLKECVGYSDADWGGDFDDHKSTSGFVFNIGGTAVSWRSKKQSCVALSTAEAEYMALASAAQEAIWMRQLITDLTSKERVQSTVIFEDNQSTICMHGIHSHMVVRSTLVLSITIYVNKLTMEVSS